MDFAKKKEKDKVMRKAKDSYVNKINSSFTIPKVKKLTLIFYSNLKA